MDFSFGNYSNGVFLSLCRNGIPKKKKAFERIITAWALTALNNGFSNEGAHDISGLMWENNRCCFQCDLGSGFEEILDALQRMLNWFCKTENLKVRLFTTQSFDKLE